LKPYEALFIFAPTLREEALDRAIAVVRGDIEKVGGRVVKTDVLGRRTFARTLNKRDSGVYVRFNVELPPEGVSVLTDRLNLNEDVFRYQIVKSDGVPAPAAAVEGPDAAGSPDPAGSGSAAEAGTPAPAAAGAAPQPPPSGSAPSC
jgi:small subunit ribosomal protein S6